MGTFATTCASGLLCLRSKDYRHVASLLFIWWLCKIPGAGKSSISNTPHKSTPVMSTEATVFVLDNHVAHDNSCSTAHHRREGLLKVSLWQSTLAGACKKKHPTLGICRVLTSSLICWCCYCCYLSQLGQDLVIWSQCDPFVNCLLRACGVCCYLSPHWQAAGPKHAAPYACMDCGVAAIRLDWWDRNAARVEDIPAHDIDILALALLCSLCQLSPQLPNRWCVSKCDFVSVGRTCRCLS